MEKIEWEATRLLGEKIGYGNLMSIASALWRNDLKKQGITNGAFIPTIIEFVKKVDRPAVERGEMVYDSWCKKFYPEQD